MELKILLILALALCASCEETKKEAEAEPSKDKRQTQDVGSGHYYYRNARKQEPVAPVEEPQDDDKAARDEQYRPGQVFSVNAQELLELQPERKAPLSSNQQLQQLYQNPQQEHKQNLQQFYYIDPQVQRQQIAPPSHTVIARPHYSSNGGEASVGAALSVSDNGANAAAAYDQDLLALLNAVQRPQAYAQTQAPQIVTQTAPPQYQQIEQYITKPSKKPTKLRPKIHVTPQPTVAPQQYLIETTNVQQQQANQQQAQQQLVQQQQQYRQIQQNQRIPQTLRYVTIQPAQSSVQQPLYERPEAQGLKVVPAPKLQNLSPLYRVAPQYQQQEATPKQFRIVDTPRALLRQEQPRILSNERPVTYLKRFPEPEKVQAIQENLSAAQRPVQIADQYYYRPVYRQNEARRYEIPAQAIKEPPRAIEATKTPLSAIYVSKNIAPKKVLRPVVRIDQSRDQQYREQPYRIEQASSSEQVNIERQNQNLDEQRSQLPPPRNNKAYTPEEFEALVAAGYSVTPIPVGQSQEQPQQAQSRSFVEPMYQRRPYYTRRNQYLPLRGDEAP
ncbi:mediator of RNA polymerase II transcription subunit 15-like isoform X1 [Colias croceus]|uniref:mediator of RNA polymerase II transcription subunit 15-like isoform X1 n=1 Tax=Colias crocea TaxID=72248 RepID=UPI001E27FD61|nr:mediator of RNA polymerase II transcription subunit 15-like isoform X1 [Colias croceus]